MAAPDTLEMAAYSAIRDSYFLEKPVDCQTARKSLTLNANSASQGTFLIRLENASFLTLTV